MLCFDQLKFIYPWRPYQQRVLDAIDQHLDDDRLHIVAAPGAGKTTLGLEVFRRLRRKTIVLSPTRIIRDQWLHRLNDFMPEGADSLVSEGLPEWTSNSIEDIRSLSSLTYQALHRRVSAPVNSIKETTAQNSEDEYEDIENDSGLQDDELQAFVQVLKSKNVRLLILDEAHHLRAEWWRVLDEVCKQIPDMVLMALTATPPYDSEQLEWQRYQALCGPIDEEISVPELVKAGTLCVHQDYLRVVALGHDESARVREYDERVKSLCDSLFQDETFVGIILAHPWLCQTHVLEHRQALALDKNSSNLSLDDIAKKPDLAIALLSFIKTKTLPLPVPLTALLDIDLDEIPSLGREKWQILIEALIFTDSFDLDEEAQAYVVELKRLLRSVELLSKRELSLVRSRRLDRSISLSPAKVRACVDIHRLETEQRRENLRQVILTDYIRDEQLNADVQIGEVSLGCWPVFNALSQYSKTPHSIAMLSGRLSIIHETCLPALLSLMDQSICKVTPAAIDGYIQVKAPLNRLTETFTQLLSQGHIKTMVGTRSLLGEGWDAPCVNSLVLASVVGSFMLSNQMRGRAIRLNVNVDSKVSSIWHLLAVNVDSASGLRDYSELKKRFNTFVGLSEKEPVIESGLTRMDVDKYFTLLGAKKDRDFVHKINAKMEGNYKRRNGLVERWKNALTLEEGGRVLPSVYTPTIPAIKSFHFRETYKALLFELATILGAAVSFSIYSFGRLGFKNLFLLLSAICIAAVIYQLPKSVALARTYLKHLPVDGSIKQIANALLEAMCQSKMIKTDRNRLKLNTEPLLDGSVVVSLAGCTFYESSLFADSLSEILSPIDNPRYLLVRSGEVFLQKRDDYHAVPLRFAIKKDLASMFHQAWCEYVSPSELIYTRSAEGKRRLLQAKMRSFSSVFESKVKREDRWQP